VYSIVPGAHAPHDSIVAQAPNPVRTLDVALAEAVVEPISATCPTFLGRGHASA
jgi:hypothetical protein